MPDKKKAPTKEAPPKPEPAGLLEWDLGNPLEAAMECVEDLIGSLGVFDGPQKPAVPEDVTQNDSEDHEEPESQSAAQSININLNGLFKRTKKQRDSAVAGTEEKGKAAGGAKPPEGGGESA